MSFRRLREKHKTLDILHSIIIELLRIPMVISGQFRKHRMMLTDNSRKLSKYKEFHNNQRCVIVVNGPSLNYQDLDKIKNEITIGCNKIYQIYTKTLWRPNYYCVLDDNYINLYQDEIFDNIDNKLITFTNDKIFNLISNKNKQNREIIYSRQIKYKQFKAWPHLLQYTYGTHQGSVLSLMMATAIYMGFKEIYVIGADNTATVEGNHFAGYKEDEDMQRIHEQRIKSNNLSKNHWKSQMSYEMDCFRDYADMNKIKIFNVTRGGRLESFVRKDFDKVFSSPD